VQQPFGDRNGRAQEAINNQVDAKSLAALREEASGRLAELEKHRKSAKAALPRIMAARSRK
jgi:hypothetical protein